MRETLISEANYLLTVVSGHYGKESKERAMRRIRQIEKELGTTLYGGYNG